MSAQARKFITPKDFKIGDRDSFLYTIWGGKVLETVARNILCLQKDPHFNPGGREWVRFSWPDYRQFLSHPITDEENTLLHEMVKQGYLTIEAATEVECYFNVTDAYIKELAECVAMNP